MTSHTDTAFILAAGKGERMRPLTDRIPKPLIQVGGKPLIEYHYAALLKAGIKRVIVNHAHLGEQIVSHMEAIHEFYETNVELLFSPEENGCLETAGGIHNALSLIDRRDFVVVNADVWSNFDYQKLCETSLNDNHCHIILVPTPIYKNEHDFFVGAEGRLENSQQAVSKGYTFSGLSKLSSSLFDDCSPGKYPLAPLLKQSVEASKASATIHTGEWQDVGTPDRLQALRRQLNDHLINSRQVNSSQANSRQED